MSGTIMKFLISKFESDARLSYKRAYIAPMAELLLSNVRIFEKKLYAKLLTADFSTRGRKYPVCF